MAGEATEGGGLEFHPLDQFEVHRLFGEGPIDWYTITNVTMWMAIAVVCIVLMLVIGTRKRAVVPNRMQSIFYWLSQLV